MADCLVRASRPVEAVIRLWTLMARQPVCPGASPHLTDCGLIFEGSIPHCRKSFDHVPSDSNRFRPGMRVRTAYRAFPLSRADLRSSE